MSADTPPPEAEEGEGDVLTGENITETVADNPEYWLKPPSPLPRLIMDYGAQCTGDAWTRALRHAAKAACARCRGGQEVAKNRIGIWVHGGSILWTCEANAIWKLAEQGDPDLIEPDEPESG